MTCSTRYLYIPRITNTHIIAFTRLSGSVHADPYIRSQHCERTSTHSDVEPDASTAHVDKSRAFDSSITTIHPVVAPIRSLRCTTSVGERKPRFLSGSLSPRTTSNSICPIPFSGYQTPDLAKAMDASKRETRTHCSLQTQPVPYKPIRPLAQAARPLSFSSCPPPRHPTPAPQSYSKIPTRPHLLRTRPSTSQPAPSPPRTPPPAQKDPHTQKTHTAPSSMSPNPAARAP